MTPGYPGNPLPPKRPVTVESMSPPSGEVQLRGKGWSANVPMVVLTALLSSLGARWLPTQTSTDTSVERASLAAERERLENERWREEQRRALAGLREDMARLDTRLSAIEAARRAPKE